VVREVVAIGGAHGFRQVLQSMDRGKRFFDLYIGCCFGCFLSLGFVVNKNNGFCLSCGGRQRLHYHQQS